MRRILSMLRRRKNNEQPSTPTHYVVGVTIGWDLKPTLLFEDGKILPGGLDRVLYPQYWQNGDWPCDPVTKERLSIKHA